jgi:hypothetical protein
MRSKGTGRHLLPLLLFAALSILWTWPLALQHDDHIPGLGGHNNI